MPIAKPTTARRRNSAPPTPMPAPIAPDDPVEIGTTTIDEEENQTFQPAEAKIKRSAEGLIERSAIRALPFWKLIEVMTEADWDDKLCYLYRIFPRAINRNVGAHSHLVKFQHAFTPDDIQNTYGGGQYRLWLKGQDGATLKKVAVNLPGRPKWTKEEIPEAPVDEAPDPAVKPADSGTAQMTQVVQLLLEELRTERAQRGDDQGAAAITNAIGIISAGARKANELIADAAKPADPASSLALVKMVLDATEKKNGVQERLMERWVDRMMGPAAQANPTDPVTQATAFADMIAKLRDSGFLGETGGGMSFGSALVQALPQLLGVLKEIAFGLQAQRRPVFVRQPGPAAPAIPAMPTTTGEAVPVEAPAMAAGIADLERDIFRTKSHIVRMFLEGDPPEMVARMVQITCAPLFKGLHDRDEKILIELATRDPQLSSIAADPGFPTFVRGLKEAIAEEMRDLEAQQAATLEPPPETVEPPAPVQ